LGLSHPALPDYVIPARRCLSGWQAGLKEEGGEMVVVLKRKRRGNIRAINLF